MPKKEFVGEVTSLAGKQSVVVTVSRRVKHPVGKIISRRSKFMAHDEKSQCQLGQKVRIVETRPISKRKTWEVVEIVAQGA